MHTQGSLLDDRYRVIRHLGSGGMASVLLCEDERLGRQVAVKRLHADSPVDVEQRFNREAKLGASLNHPNLVSVFDTATDDEGVLIVMEYVDGEPLSRMLRRGPLRPEEVRRMVVDVGDALDHAHAQGIVHRDVKPANVLIREDGVTKLADLGIATASDGTKITRSGIVLGTAAYMAPEQLEGRERRAGRRHLRAGGDRVRGAQRQEAARGHDADGDRPQARDRGAARPVRGVAEARRRPRPRC